MKIKRPEKTTVIFANIKQGDVFGYCGQYYLKFEQSELYGGDIINAVNLTNGETLEIDGYEPVTPLPDAELII